MFYFMFPLKPEDAASVIEQAYDLAKKLNQEYMDFYDIDEAAKYLLDHDVNPRNKETYDKIKGSVSQ